jgi:hypothetical protein
VQLRLQQRTLWAFAVSVMVHLLVLFAIPQRPLTTGEESPASKGPLAVRLQTRSPSSPAASAPAMPPTPRKSAAPPVIAFTRPTTEPAVAPAKIVEPAPPAQEAPVDLQAYVAAARAKRRASGMSSSSDAEDGERNRSGSADGEVQMATVMRNLRPGTNGVFQIMNMSASRAAFSFRGWTGDALNSRREYISVEIGGNSSIELAIVRRMIELIRHYYQGNFNWESERLGRVIILSARLQDNDGLEDFMLREFFGNPGRAAFR